MGGAPILRPYYDYYNSGFRAQGLGFRAVGFRSGLGFPKPNVLNPEVSELLSARSRFLLGELCEFTKVD